MSPRSATRYLFWYGEKTIAGDDPTEEEYEMFIKARAVSMAVAKKFLRLNPEDWKYTKGEPFK